MPVAPGSRCTQPGCGTITTQGSRCDKHRRKAWANVSPRNQAIDKSAWIKTKKIHLANHPACAVCGSTKDLEVDHIIEIADGGSLTDPSNLQTLCSPCHEAKTASTRAHRASRGHSPRG